MLNANHHAAFVEAWMAQATKNLPVAGRVEFFDRTFAALWRRTSVTLGEITLWAIVNRVVRSGRERFPALSALKVERGGISFTAMGDGASETDIAHTDAALRFLLVELLTVLGNLTGEILTPELHDELSRLVGDDAHSSPNDAKASRRDAGREGKAKELPHDE
jgi:hypothetical protein